MTAPAVIKQLKIQSQKDTKQLAEAKEIAYKEGFYNGTMTVGEFKGTPVQEAKPRVREKLIKAGLAFAYAEPEGLIISRSSDECVIALMDQWYLDYGEPSWRAQAEKYVPCDCCFRISDHCEQARCEDGDVQLRDPQRVRGCLGMAEQVGLRTDVRSRLEDPLGPDLPR